MNSLIPGGLNADQPSINLIDGVCVLKGSWIVAAFEKRQQSVHLQKEIEQLNTKATSWDLRHIKLDHVGATILWQGWGGAIPAQAMLADKHQEIFNRVQENIPSKNEVLENVKKEGFFTLVGLSVFSAWDHMCAFTQLLGEFVLDCGRVLRNPVRAPWKDFYGQVLSMGAKALPITGLVGLLIGIVIVYLLGIFLQSQGLGIYIVNMISLVSIRELGPLLAAVLVAGRSGSTITAQIGVMRLREELDAMHVLGISATYRLVLPRVLALALVMPLISLWTSWMAIIGGMFSAGFVIDITSAQFFQLLPTTVNVGNVWMNIGKSVLFGGTIALIGCYFGLQVKADTESLGRGTTASVVSSITAVIVIDAVVAILCRGVPILP